MPLLVAMRDGEPEKTIWRKSLRDGETLRLGRSAETCGELAVPDDPLISRFHATLFCNNGCVEVVRLARARNAICYQGQPADSFKLSVGERFAISRTVFAFQERDTPSSYDEGGGITMSFVDGDQPARLSSSVQSDWFDILTQLPEVVASIATDHELERAAVGVLIKGLADAECGAVVQLDLQKGSKDRPEIRSCRAWDESGRPRDDLELDAAWIWRTVKHEKQPYARQQHFEEGVARWVICCPLPPDADPGMCLYVQSKPLDLLTLRELLAPEKMRVLMAHSHFIGRFFSSLRQLLRLRQLETELATYFSPRILESLKRAGSRPDVLKPQLADVAVLFCDLRGSSRVAEDEAQQLLDANRRISEALCVMTEHIQGTGGAVGDFQGDAAMGFWGWPDELTDAVPRACNAASQILRKFNTVAAEEGNLLANFSCGIGIAAGSVVAGRLGNYFQRKIGVFGPPVNLAARLESLTKVFGVPILLDEEAAQALPADGFDFRLRRVAMVVPAGMTVPTRVFELFARIVEPAIFSSDDTLLRDYDELLAHFEAGQWPEARRALESFLARWPQDGPARFLQKYLAEHDEPAADWDGIIHLAHK